MSANVGSDFDPYYKWLGIPPIEQPPDYYRLLGLAMFEPDADVIAVAADRQMGHVKSFTSGPHAAHSQRLLNELSEARVGLLDPELKAVYDRQLRERLASSPRLARTVTPEIRAEGPPEVGSRPFDSHQGQAENAAPQVVVHDSIARKSRRRKNPIVRNLAIPLVGLCATGGLLWYAVSLDSDRIGGTQGDVTHDSDKNTDSDSPWDGSSRLDGSDLGDGAAPPLKVDMPPQQVGRVDEPAHTEIPSEGSPSSEVLARSNPPVSEEALFAKMPEAVSLPEFDSRPIDLGVYTSAGTPPDGLQLQIVMPDYMTGRQRGFFAYCHRQTAGELRWRVFYERDGVRRRIVEDNEVGAARAAAALRAVDGVLSFAWLSGASEFDSGDRLQRCALRLSSKDRTCDVQMRIPVIDPTALVMGNVKERHEHRIEPGTIPNPPPTDKMRLRIELLRGFPAANRDEGNPNELAEKEQLRLTFAAADYAGVEAFWEAKGKIICIYVAPGFSLETSPNEIRVLSRGVLGEVETDLLRQKTGAASEYNRRVADRAVLQQRLNHAENLNIRLAGGGTTPQLRNRKRAVIAQAQRQIALNETRIAELEQLGLGLERDLNSRLPTLRFLAKQIEGTAKVGFELYLPAGDTRIVLYRKGLSGGLGRSVHPLDAIEQQFEQPRAENPSLPAIPEKSVS